LNDYCAGLASAKKKLDKYDFSSLGQKPRPTLLTKHALPGCGCFQANLEAERHLGLQMKGE